VRKERGFAPILIIIILGIVGFVGYIGYKNYQSTNKNKHPTPEVQTPVSTSTPIEVAKPALVFKSSAEWKTYFDNEIGFSFGYPSDKFVSKYNSQEYNLEDLNWSVSDKPIDPNKVTSDYWYGVGQEGVWLNHVNKEFDVNRSDAANFNDQQHYIDYAVQSGGTRLKDQIIGGKLAEVIEEKGYDGFLHRTYVIAMKYGLLIISIVSDPAYLPYSEKFVKSFKFID
jgi:hypothetical protein